MIRAIIIDDEPSAVELIRLLLRKKLPQEVTVVATANDPVNGKQLILEHHPDIVFLDIEMPRLSGIELAAQLPEGFTRIVFITAYDTYAIHAFRVNAIDYLLKPVDPSDLLATIQKVQREMAERQPIVQQLQQLQQLLRPANEQPARIGIAMADRIVFVELNDILYCTASGAYTSIHLQDGQKLVASKSLGEFEDQLRASGFFRSHHSSLIQLKKIRAFQKHDGGYVVMSDGAQLEVSQRKRKDFIQAIQSQLI